MGVKAPVCRPHVLSALHYMQHVTMLLLAASSDVSGQVSRPRPVGAALVSPEEEVAARALGLLPIMRGKSL